MTTDQVQGLLLGAGGVAMLSSSILLTRRGKLGLRFGVGWLLASSSVLLGAILGAAGIVSPIASVLRLSATGLIVFGIAAFFMLLCLQLSMALSQQDQVMRALIREVAMLDGRLRKVERYNSKVGT